MTLSPTFETDYRRAFAAGFAAADMRSIDEWAADNVNVGSWSPWPGKMSFEHTPWLVEPLRAIRREQCHRITIVAAAAGGKSTIAETFMGWLIRNAPGFFCWFSHTEAAAKEFAETRLWPFLESIPQVAAIMPTGAERFKKRQDGIIFPHMSLLVLPANQSSAQSKHIRYAVFDEPWLYAPGILAQLHKRTTKFAHNRKILELSTGSVLGDETDQAYNQGTRREWQFKCPSCGGLHVPRFSAERVDSPGYVKWDGAAKTGTGQWDMKRVRESVTYQCPLCSEHFKPSEENGYKLNRGGCYTDAADGSSPAHESYHWPAWASDFRMLADFVVEFLQAKEALRRGSPELLQEFSQKRQAIAWDVTSLDTDEARAVVGSYRMGDEWQVEKRLRIMTVDVQKTHRWVVVRDWTNGPKTRLVWFGMLVTWEDVRAKQMEMGVVDNAVWIDSGYSADEVYQWCCRFDWIAVKGDKARDGFVVNDGGSNVRQMLDRSESNGSPSQLLAGSRVSECILYRVSDEMTMNRLHLFRTGRAEGWEEPVDAPQEYKEQMAARVRRAHILPRTGQTVWEWVTVGRGGEHASDCERYQIAAAFEAGILDGEQT